MKKNQYYIVALIVILLTSCGLNEVDNYPGPNAKFKGTIVDKTTGKGLQTEQPNGFRIKWTELSWEHNPQPEYFWAKPDGSFNWEHAFGYKNSQYEIQPVEGAFVEVEPQTFTLEKGGYPEFTFEVIPYIHIESSHELNGTELTVKFIATRPEGSFDDVKYDLTEARVLLTDKTKYVSFNNSGGYVSSLSKKISIKENQLGQEITQKVTLESGKKYYMRVMVQTKNPSKACNYTEVQEIVVP